MAGFLERVAALTGGQITAELFTRHSLAGLRDSLEALATGKTDLALVDIGFARAALPLNGVATLPGWAPDAMNASRIYDSLLQRPGPLREEFELIGTIPVYGAVLPSDRFVFGPDGVPDQLAGLHWRIHNEIQGLQVESFNGVPDFSLPFGFGHALEQGDMAGGFLEALEAGKPRLIDNIGALVDGLALGSGAFAICLAERTARDLPPALWTQIRRAAAAARDDFAAAADAEAATQSEMLVGRGIPRFGAGSAISGILSAGTPAVHQAWAERQGAWREAARQVLDLYAEALTA